MLFCVFIDLEARKRSSTGAGSRALRTCWTSRTIRDRTLKHPEFVVKGQPPRQIFMRQYLDSVLDQAMLLRVVVEETETECVVVTLYKTSQIEKYLKGLTK